MCIKPTSARSAGSGIVEYLIVIGIVSILVLVVTSLFMSSTTQIARAFNYCDMNASSQLAMDSLSRDIRNATRVISCTNHGSHVELELEELDGTNLMYIYNPNNKTLRRRGKDMGTTVLLRQCESLTFSLGKRSLTGGFDIVPNASAAECKVVNVSWKCGRAVLGQSGARENATTGQIVIRRQRT